jgi:hypothetical protein
LKLWVLLVGYALFAQIMFLGFLVAIVSFHGWASAAKKTQTFGFGSPDATALSVEGITKLTIRVDPKLGKIIMEFPHDGVEIDLTLAEARQVSDGLLHARDMLAPRN